MRIPVKRCSPTLAAKVPADRRVLRNCCRCRVQYLGTKGYGGINPHLRVTWRLRCLWKKKLQTIPKMPGWSILSWDGQEHNLKPSIPDWLVVSTPPEKYWSVGLMIPNIWKIKNVPNHQPVHVATRKSNHPGQKGQKQKTQKTHHCEHAAVAQNPGARERDGSPAEVKCHPNEPSLAVIVYRCI